MVEGRTRETEARCFRAHHPGAAAVLWQPAEPACRLNGRPRANQLAASGTFPVRPLNLSSDLPWTSQGATALRSGSVV